MGLLSCPFLYALIAAERRLASPCRAGRVMLMKSALNIADGSCCPPPTLPTTEFNEAERYASAAPRASLVGGSGGRLYYSPVTHRAAPCLCLPWAARGKVCPDRKWCALFHICQGCCASELNNFQPLSAGRGSCVMYLEHNFVCVASRGTDDLLDRPTAL